ncbi:MAG: cytochrome c [Bacteroidota bacterium]
MNPVPFFHQLAIWCTVLTAVVVSSFTYLVVKEEEWTQPSYLGCGVVDSPSYYLGPELDTLDPRYALYEEGKMLFSVNCYGCHRIHADWTGPGLAAVTERRSKLWLYDFIWDNGRLLRRGDQQAIELVEEWNGSVMTTFEWMTEDQLDAILTYVEVETERGPAIYY